MRILELVFRPLRLNARNDHTSWTGCTFSRRLDRVGQYLDFHRFRRLSSAAAAPEQASHHWFFTGHQARTFYILTTCGYFFLL